MNARKTPMKKRLIFAAAIAAAAAVVTVAPCASAETPADHHGQVVTQVKTAAAFDFAAGESPENITVNPDGSLTLSMLGISAGKAPELVRIAESGQRTVLVTGHAGDAITGNTRGRDGAVYYNVLSSDASRSGVWKDTPGGTPERIAALPVGAFPNGLAIDPSGRTLYVADSYKGTVWAVPASGGTATAWLTNAALAPDASSAPPLGANGLRFHNGAVWVSNLSKGTLLRVQVNADGTNGRIHVVTTGVVGIDDFNFLNRRSDVVFAALHALNQIAAVYPDGAKKIVLTKADGVAAPTATAVRGNRLYVTDSGMDETPHDPKLQVGKINFRALFGGAAH
ncbi:SMP-30/gluconolactonase/LRE family protein [Streptomyces sp. NPDC096311]|uniref:SMP-30/gluconolactonase/LRE family protein n=1 Tax=Streptomyces sp. NPDC096311 TaxID=3366083 RepID=UPI0037F5D806